MPDETTVLKPYWLPKFCLAICNLTFCAFFGLSFWGVIATNDTALIWLTGLLFLVLFLSALLLTLSLFLNVGVLTLDKTGLAIPSLIKGKLLYQWSEIEKFEVVQSRYSHFIKFSTLTEKNRILTSGVFPLSNIDMVDFLRNRQQHYLSGEPLKDYSTYKKQNCWCNSTVISSLFLTIIFGFLFISFIPLTLSPTSTFVFKNTRSTPLFNLFVMSSYPRKSNFDIILKLDATEERAATLKGFNGGPINLTYTDENSKVHCKRFEKTNCSWDGDVFAFNENSEIEATPISQSGCRIKKVIQSSCQ